MRRSTPWLGLLCAGSLLACDVFDESLEKRIDESSEEPDAGMPDVGEPDAGSPDAGPPLFTLGQCGRNIAVPVVEGSGTPLTISVAGLRSNVTEAGCNIPSGVLAGADGYFEIQASAGERWHFHLDAAEGQDLALLALSGCDDTRSCSASANVCGKGESEHFTFVADTAGSYAIVVEGIDAKSTDPLQLLAIRPHCGNGIKEHSEVCDFGDVMSGDGCDATCRVELRTSRAEEVEPNDDSYGANVILPPNANPVQVLGKIAGPACQPDYYLVSTDETAVLTSALLGANGKACKGAPPLEIAIFESDGQRLKLAAPVDDAANLPGDACPALPPQTLTKGSYFVRVRHLAPADLFEYRLDFAWSAPPPPEP
jgi:cysteine-rich repeat protein